MTAGLSTGGAAIFLDHGISERAVKTAADMLSRFLLERLQAVSASNFEQWQQAARSFDRSQTPLKDRAGL